MAASSGRQIKVYKYAGKYKRYIYSLNQLNYLKKGEY